MKKHRAAGRPLKGSREHGAVPCGPELELRAARNCSLLRAPLSVGLALVLVAAGCESSGTDRVLAIEATGTVLGLVFFDADGNREPGGADTPLAGVAVALAPSGGRIPVAQGISDADGVVRLDQVGVGRYVVVVDSTTVPDSVDVVRIADSAFIVGPADSVTVEVALSFPRVTVREARLLPVGTRVFVDGLALNAFPAFGDSSVHLADTSGAMRLVRVRPVPIFAGDSLRVRGTRGASAGQPTLENVTTVLLAVVAVPAPEGVTTAQGRTADGGRLDAALVAVTNATISDTATVAGDFRLRVSDGSGTLEVLLDEDAALDLAPFTPGVSIDATGLLVPTGAGVWQLKPRSDADLAVN